MSEKARAHLIVKGLVQGVFYRATTQETAQSIGITGWVRNLANGDVEVVAEGEKEQIEKLISWCRKGPPVARVSSVEVEWQEAKGEYSSFGMRY